MKKNEHEGCSVNKLLTFKKQPAGSNEILFSSSKVISINTSTMHQDETKIELISGHLMEIMKILGLNMDDEILKITPSRMARQYVKELCAGINHANKPVPQLSENKFGYRQIIMAIDFTFQYTSKHYLTTFSGKAHIGYFPSSKIIDNNDLHSVIRYIAQKPISQDELVMQVADELKSLLLTEHLAVVIEAIPSCELSHRDYEAKKAVMVYYDGHFLKEEVKSEFLSFIK